MEGDLFNGKYTTEEVEKILNINARPLSIMKPFRPYYKKTATEHEPTWREKREVTLLNLNVKRDIVRAFLDP